MDWYVAGQNLAHTELGLTKVAISLHTRSSRDPFAEVQRKLTRAFRIKTPKFDVAALLKRMLTNPFKQPARHLAGIFPGLRL